MIIVKDGIQNDTICNLKIKEDIKKTLS